ncbi:signal transduction histidine kinase [Peribacillus deserti]|uniref:histidine kinase n=1 Tax=Peribacillus deserti TaxID=673318 RepID=A0ABS2QCP6_9BACI|nr:ATP-binding protein [Peribacillus deserti]MBM7690931.1 signal transduction histidine kinase [Peribacillus deserti]
MNTNILSFLKGMRKPGKKDVFKSTQSRLTMVYSGLLMLFLVLFIVVVFAILYFVLLKDQERELESITGQKARFIEQYMQQYNRRELSDNQNQEILAGVDQFFYYVVSPEGELLMGNENVPPLRAKLLSLIEDWVPERNDIRQERLQIEQRDFRMKGKRRDEHDIHVPRAQDDIRLMIAGQPIIFNGQLVGTLYVGKDISFSYQLFKMLLIVMTGLAAVFLGIAVYISYLMSQKAMVPISKAFNRQREFVADASHELRTPLSVMLSSIDAMEMTIDTDEDDFSRKVLFSMKDEVKRMTSLVGDLLTLARSDSEETEHRREIFDFRPRAEKAVESVKPLAASKQIELGMKATDTVVTKGDPERLTQLLYILLDNAIKYTGSGGRVQLDLSADEQEMCMKVQDTGIGIKSEEHAQIFDRFYRSDKSRSRQMGSHGLGLAIAKWIVDMHGGSIEVASEMGQGSTFTVRIPFSSTKKDKT